MRAQYRVRLRLIAGCIVAAMALLVVRLYDLQVVRGSAYRAEANSQYVRSSRDLFDRGTIFFTGEDGEHLAAASTKAGNVVAINPSKITDPNSLFAALAPHLPLLDRNDFFMHAEKHDDPYEEIAHHVESDAAAAIEALHLPGVQLFREQWRYYPGNELAAQTLGFVGFDAEGTKLTGRYGLERYWESVLTRAEDSLYVNFFAELFANVQEAAQGSGRVRSGDLITSLEPTVQRELERVLHATEDEWHARQIAGIIMDPKTGDVYALASLPTFNPNSFGDTNTSAFRNPFVEDVYEMGSIIKPLAMAIGLDTGAVTPTTTYDDTGSVLIDGYTIRNYDGRARGHATMQDVLNQSLNVGMAFVARKVGGKVLGERMRELGFGEETGIDLPAEAHGLIDNLSSPREVEYATAAFGQGIALTPIATARALCALGNGGYLVTPHLVREVAYTDGGVGDVSPDDRERIFSEETSEDITRMLVTVVDTSLRGGTVKKEHYSIAAKTGTAQIAKKGERGYYDDRYLHSFFGYFPAYDPRFLIFLFHIEPQGAKYASETLTDPFMQIVDFLVNYYHVPPDR